jgi:hypothetical protein
VGGKVGRGKEVAIGIQTWDVDLGLCASAASSGFLLVGSVLTLSFRNHASMLIPRLTSLGGYLWIPDFEPNSNFTKSALNFLTLATAL